MNPIQLLNQWLAEEKESGAPDPQHAVLATATAKGIPHCRIVAIREITNHALLFFTQKNSRKVAELHANSHAAMTFWFELHKREVVIEGITEPLSATENKQYWQSKSCESQIRFYSYAETCSQPIENKQMLEDKKRNLEDEYQDKLLPLHPHYLGFRLIPLRIVFYTSQADELSDVVEYQYRKGVCKLKCVNSHRQ